MWYSLNQVTVYEHWECHASRCRNPHEARETYKTLKDQNIGGAAESVDLYSQWASLELAAGLLMSTAYCCKHEVKRVPNCY